MVDHTARGRGPGPGRLIAAIYEFRGERIAREAVCVMDGFDAPAWRASWATTFDRFAWFPAAEWTDDGA